MLWEKIGLVVSLAIIFTGSSLASNVYFAPHIPMPEKVYAKVKNPETAERLASKNGELSDCYEAGLYYFYEIVNITNGKEINKGLRKKYLDRALGCFEKCGQQEPKNPYYQAWLGSSYGLKISFSGFPALLEWSRKCLLALDKAVELDKNNPEIRLLRLRNLVHFPYQFYPKMKEEVLNDGQMVIKWASGSNSPKDAVYFSGIKNEAAFLVGNYLFSEVKDAEKAKEYLIKVESSSPYHEKARQRLARL